MNNWQAQAPVSAPIDSARLGEFIRKNRRTIIKRWTAFAKTCKPAGSTMAELDLQDHIEEMLVFIADDLESPQSRAEQSEKSQGNGSRADSAPQSAPELHAVLRLNDGFDLDQVISEYRALRATIIELWRDQPRNFDVQDLDDLTRFNEAIDQATAESVRQYTTIVEHSQHMFLGILGHDLRTPIGVVAMSAELMLKQGLPDEKLTPLITLIDASATRATRILADMLDLTQVRFGKELPICRETLEVAILTEQLVDEMRAFYPSRTITLMIFGDTKAAVDRSRMGQVLSNLIGNAIAHGFQNTPVEIVLEGNKKEIILRVMNTGKQIPQELIKTLFDSFVRGDDAIQENDGSSHLGLGLYITKRIIESHHGEIEVVSSEGGQTEFSIHIPKLDEQETRSSEHMKT